MMDRAASAGFEGIAQMLLEQKKLMDALEAENRELRRQIADLRRGVGIAVVIDGKTIQLAIDSAGGLGQPAVPGHTAKLAEPAKLTERQQLCVSPDRWTTGHRRGRRETERQYPQPTG